MAVVSCPKCTAGLRVPDGSTAAVRCPKCQTVFQPPKPKAAGPSFEVVETAPAKSAPRPTIPARPAPPKPPGRPAAPQEPEFEVVEEAPPPSPTQKKAFSLDAAVRSAETRPSRDNREDRTRDDRDRGRQRRGDDDRPRDRSRRDRDEDDEDDRRDRRDREEGHEDNRRARSRRDDGYEDDDRDRDWDRDPGRDRDRRRKPSPFGIARPAVLVILISLGLYFGGMALHALFLFVAWVGGVIPNGLMVLTGLLGLAGWLVALVGLGMSIAGPQKARGLAIAATAVAFIHLVLAFVVAIDKRSGALGSNSVTMLSALNRSDRVTDLNKELIKESQSNPNGQRAKDLRAELADGGDRGRLGFDEDSIRWHDFVTDLPRLDALIAVLVYHAKGFEYYLWGLFAGLLELARLVLLGLLLAALARSAKNHSAENAAKFGWIAAPAVVGVALLVFLLALVMAESSVKDAARSVSAPTRGADFAQVQADQERRFRSLIRGPLNWIAGAELLIYTLHAATLILPSLAAVGAFQSMGRRR
ncbi:MAG TPA: hypothetical protein VH092_01855 [Urbifossiella sp.]|nr:hypothetical protein [Urbifossiella sp.]